MIVYFVTGATGAVGSAVVAQLLTDPDAHVYALVRAPSADAAAARLEQTMNALGSRAPSVRDRERLRALAGDVEQPNFGVSDADRNALATNCTHIIHCAGAVRMNLPLATARRAAVSSVHNILVLARGLAAKGQLAKVDLVSTVGVAGRETPLLREDWVGADCAFHNTYEQAKAEAEQPAREAVGEGLPVTVHRPSMIVGDSKTGHALDFQVFYFLVEFLSGRRTAGIFPELGAARLDIVPVDFVAEAIVSSSNTDATAGRVLHLCAGTKEALTLVRLQAVVREILEARGDPVPHARYLPRWLFRASARWLRLVTDAKTRAALNTLPVFLDYLDTDQAFDNARTTAWLQSEGIDIPRTADYLPRALEFYFAATRRGRGDAPRSESSSGHAHG